MRSGYGVWQDSEASHKPPSGNLPKEEAGCQLAGTIAAGRRTGAKRCAVSPLPAVNAKPAPDLCDHTSYPDILLYCPMKGIAAQLRVGAISDADG